MTIFERQQLIATITTAIETVFESEDVYDIMEFMSDAQN